MASAPSGRRWRFRITTIRQSERALSRVVEAVSQRFSGLAIAVRWCVGRWWRARGEGRCDQMGAVLGSDGRYLVPVGLGEVVGHHQQPELGAHLDPASSVKADEPLVVFGVTVERLDRLFAFCVALTSVV